MKNKALSYLGLSMRAGKLTTGDTGVMQAIRSGEAKLVLIAEDASENTRKKYRDKCMYYDVSHIEFCTREELGGSIGKEDRVVIAVCDSGLARMIEQCHAKTTEVDEFGQTREQE